MAGKKTQSPVRDIKIKEDPNGYKCSCCSTVYKTQKGNYLKNSSFLFAGNNGFITVCKLCVEEYYKKLLATFDGNAEKATQQFCSTFDYYYNSAIFASTGKEATTTTARILLYPAKLNMKQHEAANKTFLNTIDENKNKPPVDVATEDVPGSNLYIASPEVVLAWGNDYLNEEYLYLQTEFDDYKARYDIATKAHEELVRTICVAQLSIRKTKDVGERTKMMKTLQDLIRTADLKPNRAADEAALSAENSFGMLIKKLENEKPVCSPNPEWQDVDRISKHIDTFFLSHICKLTKRQIPNAETYEEEMGKYTVKPPVYE